MAERDGKIGRLPGSRSASMGIQPNRRFLAIDQLLIPYWHRGPVVVPIHNGDCAAGCWPDCRPHARRPARRGWSASGPPRSGLASGRACPGDCARCGRPHQTIARPAGSGAGPGAAGRSAGSARRRARTGPGDELAPVRRIQRPKLSADRHVGPYAPALSRRPWMLPQPIATPLPAGGAIRDWVRQHRRLAHPAPDRAGGHHCCAAR